MFCRNCGKQIANDSTTCDFCGLQKGEGNKFCPVCGHFVIPGDFTCTECGTPLTITSQTEKQQNSTFNTRGYKEPEPIPTPSTNEKFDKTGEIYCRNCGLMIDKNSSQCEFCNSPINSATNYCNNCGKGTTSLDKTCIFCGTTLSIAKQATRITPPPFSTKNQTSSQNTTKQNKESNNNDFLITLLLCILLGGFGVHRFYTKNYITGLIQFLTGGGCGIWWIIDIIMILSSNFKTGDGKILKNNI